LGYGVLDPAESKKFPQRNGWGLHPTIVKYGLGHNKNLERISL
jgi:hypothetical protein